MRGFPTTPTPAPPTWHRAPDDHVPAAELDEAAGFDVPEADPIDRLTDPIEDEAHEAARSAAA